MVCALAALALNVHWLHAQQVAPSSGDSVIASAREAIDSTALRADTIGGVAAEEPGIIMRLLGDVGRQATAPFRMNREEALHWSGAALVTTGLLVSDRALDMSVRDLRDSIGWIGTASPIVTEMGGTAGIAGAGLFVGYSLLLGDDYDRRTSLMLGEALVTSALWTRVLKIAGGRRRPITMYAEGYDAGSVWLGPLMEFRNPDHLSSANFASFPSGHTSTAFAIATVFAERYNRTATVPVIAYSLATLVGMSRMTEHQHWASDVFVGACIGYLCGHDVVLHSAEPDSTGATGSTTNEPRMGMYPFILDDGGGIGMQVRW